MEQHTHAIDGSDVTSDVSELGLPIILKFMGLSTKFRRLCWGKIHYTVLLGSLPKMKSFETLAELEKYIEDLGLTQQKRR
jgi:hypothetical protein